MYDKHPNSRSIVVSDLPFSFHVLERFSRQMPGRQIQGEDRIHFPGDTVFLALRSI